MEQPKAKKGGNSDKPVTQTAIPLKIDNNLLDRLDTYVAGNPKKRKRNRLINSAVQQYLDKLDNMIVEADKFQENN